jgi:hypothetical protein
LHFVRLNRQSPYSTQRRAELFLVVVVLHVSS